MNLRQIEAFRAVMVHGSATAAARALGISQPAVTRLIRLLEDRSRICLFARERGRLMPTREAMLLNEEVGRIYFGIERVRDVMVRLRDHGDGYLRILSAPSVAHGWVMPRVAELQSTARALRILVDTAAYAAMIEALVQRRADIGIAMAPQAAEGLASVVVDEVDFCLVVPRGHRLASERLVQAADLEGERVITFRPDSPIFGILRDTPFGPVLDRGSLEVGSSLLACAAVANGAGIAIAERSLAADPAFSDRLACVPVKPLIRIPLRLFFHTRESGSESMRRLLLAFGAGAAPQPGPAPANPSQRRTLRHDEGLASAARRKSGLPGKSAPQAARNRSHVP
jgi:DNA-binding transcriptional LysR family regulator